MTAAQLRQHVQKIQQAQQVIFEKWRTSFALKANEEMTIVSAMTGSQGARKTVMVPCFMEVGDGRAVIHIHPRWETVMREGLYPGESVNVIVLPDEAVTLNGQMVGELTPEERTPVKTFEEKQREAEALRAELQRVQQQKKQEQFEQIVEAMRSGRIDHATFERYRDAIWKAYGDNEISFEEAVRRAGPAQTWPDAVQEYLGLVNQVTITTTDIMNKKKQGL